MKSLSVLKKQAKTELIQNQRTTINAINRYLETQVKMNINMNMNSALINLEQIKRNYSIDNMNLKQIKSTVCSLLKKAKFQYSVRDNFIYIDL